MANHESAKKRHRQSLVRRDRNRHVKSTVRTALKKVRSLVEAGELVQARDAARQAEIAIARAAAKGVYHRANASRRVSNLHKLIRTAEQNARA